MTAANTHAIVKRHFLPGQSFFTPTTRWVVTLLGGAFLVALLALGSQFAKDPKRFNVSHVDVLGTMDYADREKLKSLVKQQTELGFYGLDIDSLRQAVEAGEWIASARVRRVWPSRIVIELEEHEPAARWNDDHLISKRLVLFKPHQLDRNTEDFDKWSEVFRPLPQVIGAQGRHVDLLDSYRAYDEQLSRFNVSLSLLKEDDRLSQILTLSNGTVVRLGLEQRELRMSRFLDVYERIASTTKAEPLSFDMRYSNGFALAVANLNER